jgi:Domain of unknown function (DUF1840)
MLFKFKSKACADLIMLEADGRRILQAMIGDDPVKGIVRRSDLQQALARLDAAVVQDEALRQVQAEKAVARDPGQEAEVDGQEAALPAIRLAQRAAPMQKMLRRCMAEEADLVWGV